MKRRTLFLLGVPGLEGCLKSPAARLNVFNWSNYIAPDTLERFTRESGVTVRYAVYESNEEMLARVLSGNSGWDVVFPTHYFLGPMRAMGLLAGLDHGRLANLGALDPLFASPAWDPRLEWGVPYMWGSSGILADRRAASGPLDWASLWEERWRGRMTMLDDPGEVLGAALKKLGHSLNEAREGPLRAAQREARRQKPLLRAYLNAEVRDQAVAGDVLACQLWATTAQQAIDAAPHLQYHYPREGYPLYADCAVVLRESRRQELAHRFIDFLLRPPVAAAIVAHSRTATANGEARRLLDASTRELKTLFPDAETMARGEWFATLPPAAQRLRDRIWTEIKAS